MLFIFWIWKFCLSFVVPNFGQTLNGSPVKFHVSPFEMFQIWKFINFPYFLVAHFFQFFLFENFALHLRTFFKKSFETKKKKKKNHFFLKRIRWSKYKQQGIVKVLISYQMQNLQCSIFKIATSEAFWINTKKNLIFFPKKNSKAMHCTKKSQESKHSFSTFYISVPNFRALSPIINFFPKVNQSAYISVPNFRALSPIIIFFPKVNRSP